MREIQYLLALAVMGCGTVMDIQKKRISSRLIGYYFLAVLTASLISMGIAWISEEETAKGILAAEWILSLAAGLIPGLVCFFLSFVTEEAIGYGDSLFVAGCGMGLGVADCIQILLISCAAAGIFGMGLLLLKRVGRHYEIPFVPFLLFGTIANLLLKL